MELEQRIQKAIEKKLNSESLEKMISEKIDKGFNEALDELFKWNGDCKKIIEDKIKSVMVPVLEKYDYSKYVVKMDKVLTDVINDVTKDNRKIMENFKELVSIPTDETVKVSEIFNKWCKHVAANIDTDNLRIDYDDGVSYEAAEVNYEFESFEERGWINRELGRIVFTCEKDDSLNKCIEVYRYSNSSDKNWNIRSTDDNLDIESLRYLDKLSIYLMSLKQAGTEIEIDVENEYDGITPNKEPEATFE